MRKNAKIILIREGEALSEIMRKDFDYG